MVCFHQSEWGVEFSHLKSEIDTFLDKGINKEEDEAIKNILIERKNEALQITEAKVNALSFWKEVKVSGNSMPEGVTYEPRTNSCRKMHSWETEPILQPGESPSTLEQFPTNNKVYHFHPNMFVRQMRRLEDEGAPWMDIALAEAKKAKGVKEDQAPLTTMIKKYHNHCNLFDNPKTPKIEDLEESWCSSFVSWCLDQTNYKGLKHAGSRFYIADDPKWNGANSKRKLKAKDMLVKIPEPLYGAITVFSDCSKEGVAKTGGHVCFVYGTVEGANKLAVLGGNQGNKLKVSPYDCSGNVFVSWREKDKEGKVIKIHYKKCRGFFMPKDYKNGISLSEEHHYKSFDEANKEATTIVIKTSKDGESS